MMPAVDATTRFRSRMSDGEMREVWRELAAAGCQVRCERRASRDEYWTIAVRHPAWDGPLDSDPLPLYYFYRRDAAGTWRTGT